MKTFAITVVTGVLTTAFGSVTTLNIIAAKCLKPEVFYVGQEVYECKLKEKNT